MARSRHVRVRPRVLAAAALASGALVAAGCGSVGYLEATGNASAGKALFTAKCGSCHVLADAGTSGTIGPNLDAAFFQFRKEILGDRPSRDDVDAAEDTVRQVVRGQIAYPTVDTSTGAPGMPANIVTGQEADDVSTYVASVAGTGDSAETGGGEAAGGGGSGDSRPEEPGGGASQTAARELFSQTCAGCHTLADAGASGTVGPSLDEARPPKARVVERVTNGAGAMPPFKDSLTEQQIDDIAAYVADVAGS